MTGRLAHRLSSPLFSATHPDNEGIGNVEYILMLDGKPPGSTLKIRKDPTLCGGPSGSFPRVRAVQVVAHGLVEVEDQHPGAVILHPAISIHQHVVVVER